MSGLLWSWMATYCKVCLANVTSCYESFLRKGIPEKTTVKDVMTTDVIAIGKDTQPDEAVKLMWGTGTSATFLSFAKMARLKESWRFETYFTRNSKI